MTNEVGSGKFSYTALPRWEKLPRGWSFVDVVGVATDSHDRVFVFNRGDHPIIVFDRDGSFLTSWGEGVFRRPHGIHIGPDDLIYCTDDSDHTVRKFSSDGKLLLTLGDSGRSSDTGVRDSDYRSIERGGPPFNLPTNLALASDGSLYITDGYGNARVHKFDSSGNLLFSWGEPGKGPGKFNLPHGIAVAPDGKVFVADRENSRVQIFSPGGEFLAEWTDVIRPTEVFIDHKGIVFVSELGRRAGLFPWMNFSDSEALSARLSVFDNQGDLLARWGGNDPCEPGSFFAPHDVWLDSHGDIYVGEVVWSAGGSQGLVSPHCHCLQKFIRQPD